MKKKSLSQSAFFNLRVLIGLFLFLSSVFLALLGFGTLPTQARQQSNPAAKPTDPLVPALFDCSRIRELGIDMQENFRAGAIMIYCGEAAGGEESPASPFTPLLQRLLGPLALGTADVDLITGTETPSHITQSETFAAANPDNPLQIVIAYNDSRGRGLTPVNISGASVSTDGGNTFTRLTTASGQGPFANTAGDPVVLYNKPLATWYTVWLDGGCGGSGLGGYKSTTPWDPNSWTHYCVHTGGNDDRESGWVDNNPASPFFGRMYVSWNDFARGQAIFVRYSTDNGATWTDERQISTAFYRNVQITGDMGGSGAVYIAAMDEMGGGLTTRVNRFYRSTDGGNTWTNTYVGPSFPAPGRSASGFFATMFSNPAYWRHQGWGQPAALNGVVHYVYDARDTGTGDPANVFYIRSTDDGVTFSTPFQLNTDTDSTKAQWQPNLSVTAGGSLLAVWYDERERVAASCQPSSPGTPCYRMWARKSTDNGATWLADDMFSDVVSPLPGQPDSGIVATYVGDYDYGSPVLNQHLRAWADGRVPIGGNSQQDAFFDREPISAGLSVITSTPACNSVVSSQPTDFGINVTDPVNPATLQGSDFTVNGIPADSVVYTAGTTSMTFHFNSTPVTAQGSQTMHIPAGAFNRASDGNPVFDFTCTFRYDALPLQVTSTVPAVGGAFSPPAPGSYTYDVNFNEVVDPASIQTSDLTVSGNSAPSVVSVTLINGNTTARFMLNMNFGGTVMASIAAGAITDPFGNPGVAFSGSYTVEGCPPQNHYNITQIGGSIVPGVTDTGNHTDDGLTTVALPFSYNLYDMSFSSVNVSSNGNAQFVTMDNNWTETCLPWITPTSHNYTILPYWDDQCTGPCTGVTGTTYGIFTSTSGTAPNRIFNIEWRTAYYNSGDIALNYELRLYEGQSRFDVIYGTVPRDNTSATSGVQKDDAVFDQFFCDGSGAPSTGGQSYILQSCGTPSPTPTATATATGTPPPSPTPSPCSPIFSENFDGVVAPALPPGWVASNPVLGDGVRWATSTTAPDTAPNDAFIPDQDGISDKVLVTPNIAVPSANAVISFRNNFDTEFSDGTYWDGFVLEVSSPNIAGGAFLDITDPQVGGSFVTGGYTGTLSTLANNPLAGRMAWSASSGGYINTAINLGSNVAGHTIKLRFRMGSDEATAAPGVRIDTLVLTSGGCGTPTPTATATATATFTPTATATVPVETPTPSPSPTPTPTVTPTPTPSAAPAQALNLSTRMLVLTGDQVGIGGFIITGTAPKQVLVRGIGPSLSQFGVPNPLADPATELHGPGGFTTLFNNNWRDTQEAEIQATGLAPTDNLESAILATLDPGNYTAVVKGHDNGTGVGLVEVFDLDAPPAGSKLGNISTRAFVNTGADIMIAGFILAGASGDDHVILRGIGPSLSKFGVPNVLNDPTLELRDSNGALLRANDNWQDDPAQAAIITAAGLALTDPDESGIAATLSPGQYTALLSGVGGGVGNGLVEAYDLGTGGPKP